MTASLTRPWFEIADRYRDGVEAGAALNGMLALAEQVAASRYARALHAWTSMHDLCIAQTPCTYPYDGPYLRVSPLTDGTTDFRYVDTHVASRQWHRIVKEEEAFRRLERFIDQLHWVARESSAAPRSRVVPP